MLWHTLGRSKYAKRQHATNIPQSELRHYSNSNSHPAMLEVADGGFRVSDIGSMLGSLWARRLKLLVPALETQVLTSGRKMA